MIYPYFVEWTGQKVYVQVSVYDSKVSGKSLCNDVVFNAHLAYEFRTAICAGAVSALVVNVVKAGQGLSCEKLTWRFTDAHKQVVVNMMRSKTCFIQVYRHVGIRFIDQRQDDVSVTAGSGSNRLQQSVVVNCYCWDRQMPHCWLVYRNRHANDKDHDNIR